MHQLQMQNLSEQDGFITFERRFFKLPRLLTANQQGYADRLRRFGVGMWRDRARAYPAVQSRCIWKLKGL